MKLQKSHEKAINAFTDEFAKAIRVLSPKSQVYWYPTSDFCVLSVNWPNPVSKAHEAEGGDNDLLRVSTNRTEPFYVEAVHHVRVVPAEGGFRVSTIHYIYSIWDSPSTQIMGWHYHPEDKDDSILFPHIHVYDRPSASTKLHILNGLHIPCGRVSLEDVIRFFVIELNASPASPDWEKILESTSKVFEENKTWGQAVPRE